MALVRHLALPGMSGRAAALACAVALAVSLPYWLLQGGFWISVGTLTCIYAIAGVAWVVIGGFAGQASFGNSVFFGIGAYATALAQTGRAWGPWAGLLLGVGAAAVAAVVIGMVSFRSRGIYFALVTFTTTLVFQIFAQYFSFTGGAVGLNLNAAFPGWSSFVFASENSYYFIALAVLAMVTAGAVLLGRSSFGTELKAIRDSEEAAAACGVRVRLMKITAFTVSAILTCVAGWMYFEVVGFIDPDSAFGQTIATLIPVVAMFGGARWVAGPIVGAIVLVPLQQYTGSTGLGGLPAGTGLVIFGALVAVVLWIEPRGLLMLLRRGADVTLSQVAVRWRPRPAERAVPAQRGETGTQAEAPDKVLANPGGKSGHQGTAADAGEKRTD